MDVACGTGRNARFLAERGFASVVGVDCSDVALQKARQFDLGTDLSIEYQLHDLDEGLRNFGKFDLITMIRFVDRDLVATLHENLVDGGCALFEFHMKYEGTQQLAGPRTDRYRVQAGEVKRLIEHMEVLREFEGIITDPDGRRSAVVQLLARKRLART